MFERECGRPVSDYVCYKEYQNDACSPPNEKFQNAESALIKAFAFSPKIIQRATCELEQINIIRYLDDAPGKLQQREGEIDLSWSILRDWDFMFANRALWAHTGYAFKDIYVKYSDRREMFITYNRPEEEEGLFNLGFMAAYHHEVAKQLAQQYLGNDPQHCAPQAKKFSIPNCTPAAHLSQSPKTIDFDLDRGFSRQYDICTPEAQFAQAFSAKLMGTYLSTPYKIYIDTDMVLDQKRLLETEQHRAYAPIIDALLNADVSGENAQLELATNYQSCSGPFAAQ
jgi:hypothetical protein